MDVYFNLVEPSPLSLRHPVGVDLDLDVTFRTQADGEPYDMTGQRPQIVLAPRSKGNAYGYEMTITNGPEGLANVVIPGMVLNDSHGFNLELYLLDGVTGKPIRLIAVGQLQPYWGAYQYAGPLGPMTVPTLEGPPGPPGPPGPAGAPGVAGDPGPQGTRGGTWYVGDEFPAISMPSPTGRVDGDMYLKNIDPSGGTVWRWNGATLSWIYTGADITGPMGPPGPAGVATVSPLAPFNPVDGQLWYDPTVHTLLVWNANVAGWQTPTASWAT